MITGYNTRNRSLLRTSTYDPQALALMARALHPGKTTELHALRGGLYGAHLAPTH